MIEFTFVFLPLMCMILVFVDIAWAIFAKSTLNYAVHAGLRYGITITATQAAACACPGASDLVTMTKTRVQQSAVGLLAGQPGYDKIKIHFYSPPDPGTNAAPTLVDSAVDANKPLNIMQVSVEGFNLLPLVPRIFGWRVAADKSSSAINATSYDMIEPSRDMPPKGTAP
jgi:hypothetical protein